MNCCSAVFYLFNNNTSFCRFLTSLTVGQIVFSTSLSLLMSKLQQWLHNWAVLTSGATDSWGYTARVHLCHHTRQMWNICSTLGRSGTPEVQVAWGVGWGPWGWFLLTAPGVSAVSTLPPAVFWSGGEWKSQNLSWWCQHLYDGIMTFSGEISVSFLVTLNQLWGFFTVNELITLLAPSKNFSRNGRDDF